MSVNPPQIVGQGGPLLRPTDYRMAPLPRQIPAVPNFDPMYPPTPPPTFQQYMAMNRLESPGAGIRPPFPPQYSGESRGFYLDEMNRRMDDYRDSLFAQ